MGFPRSSGILLHPSSLPGPYGIGTLGPEAWAFIDFLAGAGIGLWQILPLGPTGYGDSPYQCLSSFAGNSNLIAPGLLAQAGLLSPEELAACRAPNSGKVD
ncbi:MAG: 4-alpha-glucanotransferase, partial [Spirochaetia bacterium]|nr:4-alpha-glucanotransferase [Spirochaetia bacterium]